MKSTVADELAGRNKSNSPSKDVIVTGEGDVMIVKVNKCDRRFRWSQAKIVTQDRFESSSDKDQIIEEGGLKENHGLFDIFPETIFEIYDKKFDQNENSDLPTKSQEIISETSEWTITKNKSYKLTRGKSTVKKVKITSLEHFETNNPFKVLENNPEEEIIIKMKKALLKKCRTCNFKRRLCMLDRSSCVAKEKTCFACNKPGHYPKSLSCRKTRKSNKTRNQSINLRTKLTKSIKKLSDTHLKLLNEKIHQLENIEVEEPSITIGCSSNQKPTFIPSDVIPFAMMFIFLNYDCIYSSITYKNVTNLMEFEKKEYGLKKSILNQAKYCARKFSNMNYQKEKRYFSTYCSQKIKEVLDIRSISSENEKASRQDTLDVFDKMYYSNPYFEDQNQITRCSASDNDIFEENHMSKSYETENEDSINIIKEHVQRSKSESDDPIPQLDGNVSESSEDENIIKKLFSVKCETRGIIQVLTFFRSLDFIWNSLSCHKLCSTKSSGENCFFCHMRSSCLRLRATRGRGPKSLRLIEFTSQLNQYKSMLGWNWMENLTDLMLEQQLKLL